MALSPASRSRRVRLVQPSRHRIARVAVALLVPVLLVSFGGCIPIGFRSSTQAIMPAAGAAAPGNAVRGTPPGEADVR
jgi:hypothetical protein